MKTDGHIPELDGVRGIAILMVLMVHFTPDVLMGNRAAEWIKRVFMTGWTGVDLFFVLSGFLITGILLRTKGQPHALRIFFARRALRIFPLYITALVAVFVVVPGVMLMFGVPLDPSFREMLNYQGWAWVHSTNIGMYLEPARAFQSPVVSISHFWSLSVEEHFYLLWPFLVFAITRRQLRWCCAGIFCFALALRIWGTLHNQNPYFFVLTPCRIDALVVGGFIAAFAYRRPIRQLYPWAILVFGASASALAANFVVSGGLWPRSPAIQGPGLSVIALLFGSVMVIVLSSSVDSWPRRFTCNSTLRFFGKYSYGIYVIHGLLADQLDRLLPFAGVVRFAHSAALAICVLLVVKIGVSVVVAPLSWRVVEAPALRLKRRFEVQREVAVAA